MNTAARFGPRRREDEHGRPALASKETIEALEVRSRPLQGGRGAGGLHLGSSSNNRAIFGPRFLRPERDLRDPFRREGESGEAEDRPTPALRGPSAGSRRST